MASLLGSILLGACSVVGVRSGTEEPPFTVLERSGEIEVRQLFELDDLEPGRGVEIFREMALPSQR